MIVLRINLFHGRVFITHSQLKRKSRRFMPGAKLTSARAENTVEHRQRQTCELRLWAQERWADTSAPDLPLPGRMSYSSPDKDTCPSCAGKDCASKAQPAIYRCAMGSSPTRLPRRGPSPATTASPGKSQSRDRNGTVKNCGAGNLACRRLSAGASSRHSASRRCCREF